MLNTTVALVKLLSVAEDTVGLIVPDVLRPQTLILSIRFELPELIAPPDADIVSRSSQRRNTES